MNYLSKVTSSCGSAIIVTTCSAKVASVMETLPRCNLGIVSADDCWSILKHRAVSDNNAPLSQEFERIGRQIAEQCAGVPLVAEVLYYYTMILNFIYTCFFYSYFLSIKIQPVSYLVSAYYKQSKLIQFNRIRMDWG